MVRKILIGNFKGPKGDTGPTGPTGPVGATGPKGDKGDPRLDGVDGVSETPSGTADSMVQNSLHTLLASAGGNWQYFTPSVGNVGNYSATTVNSQNFKTRVQFGTNKTTNPCAIAFTYYKITVYYSPPQNI